MTTPQNKQKQQLAAKQGELRNLKLEESTLLKLSALVNDQITRLKVVYSTWAKIAYPKI